MIPRTRERVPTSRNCHNLRTLRGVWINLIRGGGASPLFAASNRTCVNIAWANNNAAIS